MPHLAYQRGVEDRVFRVARFASVPPERYLPCVPGAKLLEEGGEQPFVEDGAIRVKGLRFDHRRISEKVLVRTLRAYDNDEPE